MKNAKVILDSIQEKRCLNCTLEENAYLKALGSKFMYLNNIKLCAGQKSSE
jgi:hypothetical protein